MSLFKVGQFCQEIKTNWDRPEAQLKYTRLVKELDDRYRKILLSAIQTPNSDELTYQDLEALNNEIQRIKPIIETDEAYDKDSTRGRGFIYQICRIIGNLFGRTRSSEVIDAIRNSKEKAIDPNSAEALVPLACKTSIPKPLFQMLSHLPARELNDDWNDRSQIRDFVQDAPIVLLYQPKGGLFLGFNLKAEHIPTEGGSTKESFQSSCLIQLSGQMAIFTEPDWNFKNERNPLKDMINAFDSEARAKNEKAADFSEKLNAEFSQIERQDGAQPKSCYSLLWLISRLVQKGDVLLRDVNESGFYNVRNPTCENFGYWKLTPHAHEKEE